MSHKIFLYFIMAELFPPDKQKHIHRLRAFVKKK